MEHASNKIPITNESRESLPKIIRLRLPWLIVGLAGGTLASITVSRFEKILSENISLAFFLPIIVYMSDAVGTQTETMYVRILSHGRINFIKNIFKELSVGMTLGTILSTGMGTIAWFWLDEPRVALSVAAAMFINVLIAPLIALTIPEILFKQHTDPALGAGPITTIIQDFISLIVYFVVATAVIGIAL